MASPYDFTDAERDIIGLALEHEARRVQELDGEDGLDAALALSVIRLKVLGKLALEAGR